MGRLEKFRSKRKQKKKIALSVIFISILLACGIFAADYSVNSLMLSENGPGIFKVRQTDGSKLEITVMNKRFYINTSYIARDCQRLKKAISGLLR